MTWVRIDDIFPEHPKVVGLSDGAFRLHISGLCYAGRQLTDGHIPAAQVPRLARLRNTGRTLQELIAANLWHRSEAPCDSCVRGRVGGGRDEGYLIHEYTEYQSTRAYVMSEREAARRRRLGAKGASPDVRPNVDDQISHTPPIPSLYQEEGAREEPDEQSVLAAALTYAGLGWRVFPAHSVSDGRCTCGKSCSSPAKHPRIRNWPNRATTDHQQIRRWWQMWPNSNVAIATGNGLVVLDIDAAHGGFESLAAFGELPDTPLVMSGGGGFHYYFGGDAPSGAGLLPGIDVRGEGGCVIAPPSAHITGTRYQWSLQPSDAPLAPFRGFEARKSSSKPINDVIHEGTRNVRLASLAGAMRRNGLPQSELEAELLAINAARCSPPLAADEVRKIAASVARYVPATPSGTA